MQTNSVPVSTEQVLAIVRRIINEGDVPANDEGVSAEMSPWDEIEREHPLVSRYLDGKSFDEAHRGFANERGEHPFLFRRADGRTGFTVAMDVFGVPANLTFSTYDGDDPIWCDADFDLDGASDTDSIFSKLFMSIEEIYGHKFTSEAEGEFFSCNTWKLGQGYITLQRVWTADSEVGETITVHRFYSDKPAKT